MKIFFIFASLAITMNVFADKESSTRIYQEAMQPIDEHKVFIQAAEKSSYIPVQPILHNAHTIILNKCVKRSSQPDRYEYCDQTQHEENVQIQTDSSSVCLPWYHPTTLANCYSNVVTQGMLCTNSLSSTFQCHWVKDTNVGTGTCVASASCGCPGKTVFVGSTAQILGTTSRSDDCINKLCNNFVAHVSTLGLIDDPSPAPQSTPSKINPYCSNYSNIQTVLESRKPNCTVDDTVSPVESDCCIEKTYCSVAGNCQAESSLESQIYCP